MARQYVVSGFPSPIFVDETTGTQFALPGVFLDSTSGGIVVIVDVLSVAEWRSAIATDLVIPTERRATLATDASMSIGYGAALLRDATEPVEWTRIILARDDVTPVEILASVRRDDVIGGFWRLAVLRDLVVCSESSNQLASDASVSTEWSGVVIASVDSISAVEWGAMVGTTATTGIEYGACVFGEMWKPVEFSSVFVSDTRVAAEWSHIWPRRFTKGATLDR